MLDCRFQNFDIAVHGHASPYLVHALYGGQSAEGELAVDRHAGDWPQRLLRLGAAGKPPGCAYLEESGALLYAALWRDQVRDLWLRARADLGSGVAAGVRVRLSLSPPAVAALPWEALYDGERAVLLAAGVQTPLVRVVNLLRYVGTPRPLATHLPLRVLAAMPEDPTGQVDDQAEWNRLAAALAPLQPGGVQLLPLRGRFGLLELRRRLEELQPHVLHLVTHGRPDGLLLWQAGEPQLAPAAALRAALEGADSLRLLLLAACSSGQAVEPSPLASLGAQLLRTGVPAVIAMQYDVRAEAAAAFGEHFYTHLIAGPCAGLVDVAVNYARSSLYLREPNYFAYGAPVLWLNSADGRIFTPQRPFVLSAPAAPVAPLPPSAAEVAQLLTELATFESWLAALPAFERSAVPAPLRSIAAGRQEHIQIVFDWLALLAGKADPLQRALGFAQKRAEFYKQRDQIDRLTVVLTAVPPGGAADA